MPDLDPGRDFVPAYDKTTGQKVEHPVPPHFFDLFPNLARTPQAAAAAAPKPGKEG